MSESPANVVAAENDAGAPEVVELKPVAAIEPELARRDSGRIAEVDALRGIAAAVVVLYHFTQRYGEFAALYPAQYPIVGQPWFKVPWGHFGVQLFFMISGFVILMTVMKVKSVGEFALLRFVRLYPAFWTACVVTFTVTSAFHLPLREVSRSAAAINLTMMPQVFGAWYIDPVYWTLQQEMMFYVVMGVMLALGLKRYSIWAVAGLVVASLCGVGVVGWHSGPGTPLYPVVNFEWFSLFLVGMVVYDSRERGVKWWHIGLIALCAADVLRRYGLRDQSKADWGTVWADGISAVLLIVATRWRVPLLANRVLVFLGTISYCLYLVHQNVGYVVLRGLYERGMVANAAIPVAIGVALVIATAITYGVERPACAWARQWVRKRRERGVSGVSGETRREE